MKRELPIAIFNGEVYVPLWAIADLLKATGLRADALGDNPIGLGCHEEDYRGPSR